ncbi:MAG: sterol desaturase family protein [Pseudomonadota bacterium]
MDHYWDIIVQSYTGYARYLWHEISHPGWHNYLLWLIGVSAFFLALEWWRPWRTQQKRFRQDFWLDLFYLFFNFFLFALIVHNAASDVVVNLFNDTLRAGFGFDLRAMNPLEAAPYWCVLLVGFVVRDFVHWWIHRLLHYSPLLWRFHKVHHSVKEMGFAAHLRFHWMETVIYRTLEYVPLALLGIGLYDFFVIHIFTLAVGHYNHSNLSLPTRHTGAVVGALIGVGGVTLAGLPLPGGETSGWSITLASAAGGVAGWTLLSPVMKKIFNHPEMHIWHHAKDLPEERRLGVNFGLTLAVWDYLFKTAYVPHDGRDIALGFPGDDHFPRDFVGQSTYGFTKVRRQR